MANAYASSYIFTAILFFSGLVQSNVFDTFTQDVQSSLPSSDFSKLFKLKHDSVDQVKQALVKATNKFADTLETSVPDNINDRLKDRAEKVGNLTSMQFFMVFTKALSGTLGDQGILYSGNENDIVNTYVDKLKMAAKAVDSKNVLDTLPAVANANAEVLKSMGLSGLKLILINYANTLISKIDMVKN